MIHAVPYRGAHMLDLEVQEAQAWMTPLLTDDALRGLEGRHAYTAMDGGQPLACAGVFPVEEHRGFMWSFVGAGIGPWRFCAVVKMARQFLDALPFRRVEAAVACDFDRGHRLARVLGFRMEAERMRGFQADGTDAALYARVRG